MYTDKDSTLYNCLLQYTAHSWCWPHHSRTSHFVSDFTFLVFRISFSLAYFLPALQKDYPVKNIIHKNFYTFHSILLLIASISECTLHSDHGVQQLTKMYITGNIWLLTKILFWNVVSCYLALIFQAIPWRDRWCPLCPYRQLHRQ